MKKTILALGMVAALATGSVMAHQAGDVIVRGGGILAAVKADSTTKVGPEVRLDVNHNAQLGLTATYMFTDNLGVELLGATPFSHKVSAVVPALGTKANLGNVVKVKHLPPSLYVQYYFLNKDSGSRPYIGAGLNYTRFFGAKALTPAVHDLSIKKHSFAPVINAGIDIKLADNLFLNTSVWYTRIKTTAKFKTTGVVPNQTLDHEVKIKLDPMIFFLGLGYRF